MRGKCNLCGVDWASHHSDHIFIPGNELNQDVTTIIEPQSPPAITLTEEQQHASDTIISWVKDDSSSKSEFRLGGYAGTGKTTIIKHLLKSLEKDVTIEVAAFTGKAVNVLQRKQIYSARTLHSLLYDVNENKGIITFDKKPVIESHPDLIIVDESSMLSTELYTDLTSHKLKYLFIGDPGQLEPVGDNPNLMAKPDITLSKIHRQAEKSPIIALANRVRTGATFGYCDGEELKVCAKKLMTSEAVNFDQIICAKNKTREGINSHIRKFKILDKRTIVTGEKIIVLRNNRNLGVFNGMILFVIEIKEEHSDHWVCNCKDEIGTEFNSLPIWKTPYENPELVEKGQTIIIPRKRDKVQLVYTTYAYCITCHKSQGSEWDNVLVWDEWLPPNVWDMKRWRYTAITRAAKKLTYML